MITSSTWTRGTLASLLLCLAGAAASQAAPPSGSGLLRRILLNEDRARFDAVQTITQYARGRPTPATVTHVVHMDSCRSRVEFRLPSSAAGRVVVDDGKRHWEYDPRLNTAVSMPGSWRPTRPKDAERIVARILRSYAVTVSTGPVVSGRPTWCVRMSPKDKDRDRQTWCADRASALVLERQVNEAGGRLKSSSVYSGVNYRPAGGSKSVSFSPPKGARIIDRRERPPAANTLVEAQRLASGFGKIAGSLGRGFEFESAQIVSVRGARSLHVEYSDGLIGVSLIHLPKIAKVRPNSPAARRVEVGRCAGTLSQGSRYAVLSWSSGHSTHNLVADLSQATLLDIARRMPTN